MQLPIVGGGDPTKAVKISDEVLDKPVNTRFLAHVIRAFLTNRRQDTAHTKTRGEVSGGGRKPWRQKGSGRARHGSIRSPIWVGGGVVFGPRKNRRHTIALSSRLLGKAKTLLLIDKIKHQAITIVSSIPLKTPKTKTTIAWLENLSLPEGRLLMITKKIEPNVLLASRNIPGLDVMSASHVNAYDLISHNHLIIEAGALEIMFDKSITQVVALKSSKKTARVSSKAAKTNKV